MQLRATPLDAPDLWGQFNSESRQDVLLIFLNAGTVARADWQCAAFDLEAFRSTQGVSRLVHTISSEGGFETTTLASWITSCKSGLRGNSRGVIYFDQAKEWQRLHILLDELVEV